MSSSPIEIDVDGLTFAFPSGWRVWKYDKSSYYRNQFQNSFYGAAAVDLIAIEPNGTVWLIEVKDYRRSRRTKPEDLPTGVARKVRDTLAAILPAAVAANDEKERAGAQFILSAKKIRIALHLEQPEKRSKLYPQVIDPADCKQKLRNKRCVKAIDPHPLVTGTGVSAEGLWRVS